jgi:hypothetical protein
VIHSSILSRPPRGCRPPHFELHPLWSRLEITPSRRVSEPVNADGPTLSQTVLSITAPAECRGAGTQPQPASSVSAMCRLVSFHVKILEYTLASMLYMYDVQLASFRSPWLKISSKITKNLRAAGASPRTPLGELTALPQTP